jgi:anti-sigma regulatory factor (Ser/Thr protein kinase)
MSPRLSFQFVPSTRAPSIARAQVREFLAANGATNCEPSDLQFTSSLLTSELVTHAMEHGAQDAGDMVLVLDLAARTLHAELSLDDVALPIDVAPPDERQIACGLAVIDALARRWGGSHTGDGTRLWFDLDVGCA